MREGCVVAELPGDTATEEMIMTAATNAHESSSNGAKPELRD